MPNHCSKCFRILTYIISIPILWDRYYNPTHFRMKKVDLPTSPPLYSPVSKWLGRNKNISTWWQSLLSWLICHELVILKDLRVHQNVKKNHKKKNTMNSLCTFQKTILIKPMVFMATQNQRLWANSPMQRSYCAIVY